MLDPARIREKLPEFLLGNCGYFALFIKKYISVIFAILIPQKKFVKIVFLIAILVVRVIQQIMMILALCNAIF